MAQTQREQKSSRYWRSFWAPLLFFTLLTVLMTWPLAAYIRTSVIGINAGDNWYYVWLVGWFQKALFQYHQNPLIVQSHNYPTGWNLAYSEITLANVIPALPVSLLGGPVLGYNFAILLSFVLSGLFMFWWVRSLTRSTAAGLVAGTIFAYAPYRLAHVNGHLPLMGTQYLVLHYAGLFALLKQRSFSWSYAALAGVGLGLASLSSMYYLYMTLVVSSAFVLTYVLLLEHKAIFRSAWWRNLLASGIVALPFILVAVLPYLQLSRQGGSHHRPLIEVDMFSASPTDFFLPAPVHFIWGDWVLSHFDRSLWIEQTIYIGAVVVVLAGLAWVWRKKKPDTWKPTVLFAAVAAIAMVLAMGTTLHWFRERVIVHIPGLLRFGFLPQQAPIPLPNYLLYKYLPFYNGMRAWMRYGIYANLFLAVLAGIGFTQIIRLIHRRSTTILVLSAVLVLVGIDFYNGPSGLSEVKPRPVDLWLASQPADGAFIQFPFYLNTSPPVVYGTLFHNIPFKGMFYGAYLPENYAQEVPVLAEFPDKASVELLQRDDVKYILVEASRYPDWQETSREIESLGLKEAAVIDGQHVYEFASP